MNRNRALFCNGDLHSWLQGRLAEILQRCRGLSEEYLKSASDDEIVSHMIDNIGITPVCFESDKPEIAQREGLIDVSHDPRRGGFGDRQLTNPSCIFTYSYPVSGRLDLLNYTPSTFSLNPPRASLGKAVLHLQEEYPLDTLNAESVDSDMLARFQSLRNLVASTNSDVEKFLANLPSKIKGELKKRRSNLEKSGSILDELKKKHDK